MGKKLWEKAGLVGRPVVPAPAAAGADAPPAVGTAATGVPPPAPSRGGTAGAAAMMLGAASVGPSTPAAAGEGLRAVARGTAGSGAAGEGARAKTAPGTMLGFMTAQSAAVQEAEQLRQRLAAYDGAQPARLLPAVAIRPSAWANRHDASFLDPAFEQLKSEIASAGGNVQPIKVRPLAAVAGAVGAAGAAGAASVAGVGPSNPAAGEAGAPAYEIVYGHRRHRACLALGLPVLAVVEPLSEQQLFEQMERENRARKDLSAWEQGMMYARALDQGLYPSNRQLALAIGKDLGDLGKALALARLPQAVVEAFKSPLDLQYRWAKPLADAQQQDPDGLIARALALKGRQGGLQARQIYEALLAGPALAAPDQAPKAAAPREQVIKRGRRTLAVLTWEPDGRTRVVVQAALDDAQRQRLAQALEACLAELGG